MKTQRAQIPVETFVGSRWRNPRLTAVASVLLSKVAKHLALLACLLIVSQAGGRLTIAPSVVFFLTIFASIAHLAGRALAPRLASRPFKTPP